MSFVYTDVIKTILKRMIEFLIRNKEWIFSGIGIPIIAIFWGIFYKKKRSNVIIINNNELSVSDVKVIAESVFIENFPKLAENAKLETIKNKDEFIRTLINAIEDRLAPSKYSIFEKPDIQYILLESIITASRSNSKEKKEILSNLIIERINKDENEFSSIIYNEAIKSISLLTSDQIYILGKVYITTILIYAINNNIILFDSYDSLAQFLSEKTIIESTELEHLTNCKLLTSTFPYELDLEYLDFPSNKKLVPIISKIKEWIENNERLGIKQLKLTSVGIAISQTYNSMLFETSLNLIIDFPVKLADFKARNVLATGNVIAHSSK